MDNRKKVPFHKFVETDYMSIGADFLKCWKAMRNR